MLEALGPLIFLKYTPLPNDLCPVGLQTVEERYRESEGAIYDAFKDLEPPGYCQLFATLVFHKLVTSRDLSLRQAVLELQNLSPVQVAELMRRYGSAVIRFMKVVFAELNSGLDYKQWLLQVSEHANIERFRKAARDLVAHKVAEVGRPFFVELLLKDVP